MTARRSKEKAGVTAISPPIIENVEVERPLQSRGHWQVDDDVKLIMETAESGKARRIVMSEADLLRKIHMHIRHAGRVKGYKLRYKKLDDRTLITWMERLK